MNRHLSSLGWSVGTAAALAVNACSAVHTIGDATSSGGTANAGSGGRINVTGGASLTNPAGSAPTTGGNAGMGGMTLPATTVTGGNAGMGGMTLPATTATGGNAGMGGSNTGGSAIVTGGSGTGGGPAGPCRGTLDTVSKVYLDCPATLCEAESLANSCGAEIVSATIGNCGNCFPTWSNCYGVVSFDLGAHSKTCYYGGTNPQETYQRVTNLVGAKCNDDSPSFCGFTSYAITGGDVPSVCELNAPKKVTCYDADAGFTGSVSPSFDAGSAPTPASNCYDNFSNVCQPCCPSDHDCTNKPDGYPGYLCTPENDSYCSCSCQAGQWRCAC